MPTVWISVLTSVGCFEGLRVTGSVFQLFRKPGAVGSRTRKTHIIHTRSWGCVCVRVVECKIELTFVKLGAAYYGIFDVERKMKVTFVKLGAAYYGMWQSMIYKYILYRKITPFERLGWLAPARQLLTLTQHTCAVMVAVVVQCVCVCVSVCVC